MWNTILRRFFILVVFIGFSPFLLHAGDGRTIPLDMYLIIDNSIAIENSKKDTIDWITSQVVDRILTDGDKITIWAAGDKAELIYSDTLSGAAAKKGILDKLQTLKTGGKKADFTGALRDVLSRVSQTAGDRSRISYTMLITGSAEGMEPAISAGSQGLLRWFRSEKYERWQVLVVAPDIGKTVQQAAAAYMASLR